MTVYTLEIRKRINKGRNKIKKFLGIYLTLSQAVHFLKTCNFISKRKKKKQFYVICEIDLGDHQQYFNSAYDIKGRKIDAFSGKIL